MRRLVVLLAALVAIAAYLIAVWDKASASPCPGGIAELTTVSLGGQLHAVTIRSRLPVVKENAPTSTSPPPPVLLSLHGGPGASEIPFLRKCKDEALEEHFVVVHYDQRSAGKSCRYLDRSRSNETLTIAQHVQDAVELILYLRERFQVEKIHLTGGSWGSVLSMLIAHQYPQYVHAVAVRGLVVNLEEGERLSNEFVLQHMPEFQTEFLDKGLGPPYGNRYKDLARQRNWLFRSGGMHFQGCHPETQPGLFSCHRFALTMMFLEAVLTSPEYSWSDALRFEPCFMYSLQQMWPEVEKFDLLQQVPSLQVPLLVLHGRYDYNTPHALVQPYLDQLKSNHSKNVVWFARSGHSPHLEETEAYQQALLSFFLGTTEDSQKL